MAQLDDLERLNELRENGTLNYQEFVAEKAKLLERQGRSGASRWALPQNIGEWRRSRWSLIPSLVLVPLVIFGIHELRSQPGVNARGITNTVAEGTSPSDASDSNATDSGPGDVWTVTTSKDAMTDALAQVATASFPGDLGRVEVEISCDNRGMSHYEARSFDKNDKPLAMQTDVFNFTEGIPYELRINDREPQSWRMPNPRYNNAVDFEPLTLSNLPMGLSELPEATKLTLRLHLDGGDQTVAIDQTDRVVQSVVQPCVAAARNARVKADAASRSAAPTPAPTPTGRTTTTSAM
jgi:hypothetical protein